MLNKNYFIYLFKSKKHLFLIVCILQAIISFSFMGKINNVTNNTISPLLFSYLIGLAVAFVLPLNIFSYVHNKKAVDTYFSLDMSRNTLLFTGLSFCFISVLVPYLMSLMITGINILVSHNGLSYFINVGLLLVTSCVTYLMVIVFNTFIYFIANTVTDGIVILAAYYFIPLLLLVACSYFQGTYLIGVDIFDSCLSDILIFLSPIALSAVEYATAVFGVYQYAHIGLAYFVTVVYCILFTFLLFKTFKARKVERAGNYSDTFFSYPFIITFYTAICLIIIGSMRLSMSFSETIICYVLLFAAYFISNFVYVRKFALTKVQVILFIVGVCLSLCFNYVCEKTRGFGLSDFYQFDYNSMNYSYYASYYDDDTQYYDFFKKIHDGDLSYFSVNVSSNSRNHNTVDIFEKYRKYAIEHYLDDNYYATSNNYLSIICLKDNKNKPYNYSIPAIDIEDFKKLAKDKDVEIILYDGSGNSYHLIYEDDTYQLVNDEFYSVYENFGYDTATDAVAKSTNGSN